MFWNKKPHAVTQQLSELLSDVHVQAEFLGMKPAQMPNPEQIKTDAARLIGYTNQPEYKTWAKEAWAKFLGHMDVVMDAKSSTEKLHYSRGAAAATLDLLRVSYQARLLNEQLAKDAAAERATTRR